MAAVLGLARRRLGDPALLSMVVAVSAVCAALFALSAYYLNVAAFPAALAATAFAFLAFERPAWAVAAGLAAAPLEALNFKLPSGAISPTEAALAFVGVAYVGRALLRRENVVAPSLRDAPIVLLLGVAAVGIAVAEDPAPVMRVLTFWVLFYFVYLQVQSFGRREIRIVLIALVAGAGILGMIGAVEYIQGGAADVFAGGVLASGRAVGSFEDANYFASFLQLALLPALALLLVDFRRNVWVLPFAAGTFAGLLFSLSRGATAGFIVGLLLLLAWRRARWVAVAIAALVIVVTAAGANPATQSDYFGTVEKRLSTIGDPTRQSQRPEIYEAAIDEAIQHPFFGIGINQFRHASAQRGLVERGDPLENAHSIPLSLAAETGLFGLTAFLVFLGQLVARTFRAVATRDALAYGLALGIAASLLGFLIQGLTATQIRTNILTGTFFLLAGMLTALADRRTGQTTSTAAG
jgi:putative inorganic carbon (hco3(-)) transporter